MTADKELGREGEALAADYLREKGYEILHLNWRSGRREVDLIVKDGPVLVFVEVKSRRTLRFGTPELAVDRRKQGHLQSTAGAFLSAHFHEGEIRFDVVSVFYPSSGKPEILHIPDAFF